MASIFIFVAGAVVLRCFTNDTSICAAMAGAAATLAVAGGGVLQNGASNDDRK